MKIVLITGASSGIGNATANYLAEKGFIVYGACRTPVNDQRFKWLKVDVRQEDSVAQAVEYVIGEEGRIDVLINNAGVGIAGALEETDVDDAQDLFNTNFFGAARLTNAVIGAMRTNGCGTIVNVSSLAGKVALPFQGYYSASKFALEAYADALRMEVDSFNISIVNIQLGDILTNFTVNRKIVASDSNVYQHQFSSALSSIETDEHDGCDPYGAAKKIYKIIQKRKPKSRYSYGKLSQIVSVRLKPFIPESLFQKMLKNHYNVR